MFTLNKSLAKLKASLQSLNLIEGENTKDGNTKTNKAQKLAKPKAKRSKNKVCFDFDFLILFLKIKFYLIFL